MPTPVIHTPASAPQPFAKWQAQLQLRFDRVGTRSTLAHRSHTGPLVVQKPLYPENEAICQCVIVHPPGGIAGGDELDIQLNVTRRAHAQLLTPGAAKWYRSTGPYAAQQVSCSVEDNAMLEWMPHGAIVYDGARCSSNLRISLSGNAAFIGWDLVCLGRTSSNERFEAGAWRQRMDIIHDDVLIWSERAVLEGGSRHLFSASGLNGMPVFGTFMAVGDAIDDVMLAGTRGVLPHAGEGAVTRLNRVLVGRYRGESLQGGFAYFSELWALVRPDVVGRAAVTPRLWHT